MSRLECLGKSSKVSQKQVILDVTSTLTEIHKPEGTRTKHDSDTKVVEAKALSDKPQRRLPVHVLSHSVKGSGSAKVNVLCAGEPSIVPPPGDSITITPGAKECNRLTVVPIQDLKINDPQRPQLSDSAVAGGKAHTPRPIEALPPPEPHVEEDQTEEEDDENDEDEGRRAPLELMAEFLKAVMGKDFQLASKLCEMILIYEPENPEARQFLPLIQEQLLEEQEEEHSIDDDEDDDEDSYSSDEGDSHDSESDEEASQSSGSSSSSSSEDDEEEDMHRNRHEPCPPSPSPP